MLRAIAVMDIEIEDRHPLGAMRGLRVAGRDRRIVEKAKGEIWFKTIEGKGTSFYIQLPLFN